MGNCAIGLMEAECPYDEKLTPEANFGNAIDDLADKGTPPAILIDEYDDPVAKALKNPEEAEPHEYSFGRCLQFLLQGQGFRVEPEKAHAGGRTDIVADHPCGTYVFELKVDKPPKLAMSQIQRRKYAAPYRAVDGRASRLMYVILSNQTGMDRVYTLRRLLHISGLWALLKKSEPTPKRGHGGWKPNSARGSPPWRSGFATIRATRWSS